MLSNGGCPKTALSIKDALEALEGRWKLLILFSLSSEPRRFKQIAKEVAGITDKTLSKELKSLEGNKLIKRQVFDTFPPTVEYSITAHGMSLEKVMDELHFWGLSHRKEIMENWPWTDVWFAIWTQHFRERSQYWPGRFYQTFRRNDQYGLLRSFLLPTRCSYGTWR